MSDIDDGIIDIRGKKYITVARRIRDFREAHPDYAIVTKVLSAADLVQVRAKVKDSSGRVLATGTAEEIRGATNINKVSCVENCETSAVGRALGMLGYGGSAIASAEEMESALEQQDYLKQNEDLIAHNAAVRDNFESIAAVKAYLHSEDYQYAYEAMAELDDDTKRICWRAPSNGGLWTTRERAQMKSNEWTDARQSFHAGEE